MQLFDFYLLQGIGEYLAKYVIMFILIYRWSWDSWRTRSVPIIPFPVTFLLLNTDWESAVLPHHYLCVLQTTVCSQNYIEMKNSAHSLKMALFLIHTQVTFSGIDGFQVKSLNC
jgi:hypothetical protein